MCIIRQLIYEYSEIDALPKLERLSSSSSSLPLYHHHSSYVAAAAPSDDTIISATSTSASTRTPSSSVSSNSAKLLFQNLPGSHDDLASRDVLIFQKIASVMPEEQLLELLRGVREKSKNCRSSSKQDTETLRQMASAMPARSLLHLLHSVTVEEKEEEEKHNDAHAHAGTAVNEQEAKPQDLLDNAKANDPNIHMILSASLSSRTSTSSHGDGGRSSSSSSNSRSHHYSSDDHENDDDEEEEAEKYEEFANDDDDDDEGDASSYTTSTTMGVDDFPHHDHPNEVINILGLSMVRKDEDARQQQEQHEERLQHQDQEEQHLQHLQHQPYYHDEPAEEGVAAGQDDTDEEETFDDETTISYDVSRASFVSCTSAANSQSTGHETTIHSLSGHGVSSELLPPPLPTPPLPTATAAATATTVTNRTDALPPKQPRRRSPSPARKVPRSLCNSMMTTESVAIKSPGGRRRCTTTRGGDAGTSPLVRSVRFNSDQLQQVFIVPRLDDTEHYSALWWRREEMHAIRQDCARLAEQYVMTDDMGPAYVEVVSRILHHNGETSKNIHDEAHGEVALSNLAQHEVCRGLERHILEECSDLTNKHAKTVLKAQAEFRKKCRWGSHCKTKAATAAAAAANTVSTPNHPNQQYVDASWDDLAAVATKTSRKLRHLAVYMARHDFRQAFGYGRMQQRDYRRAFGCLPMAPRRPSGNSRPLAVVLKPNATAAVH